MRLPSLLLLQLQLAHLSTSIIGEPHPSVIFSLLCMLSLPNPVHCLNLSLTFISLISPLLHPVSSLTQMLHIMYAGPEPPQPPLRVLLDLFDHHPLPSLSSTFPLQPYYTLVFQTPALSSPLFPRVICLHSYLLQTSRN